MIHQTTLIGYIYRTILVCLGLFGIRDNRTRFGIRAVLSRALLFGALFISHEVLICIKLLHDLVFLLATTVRVTVCVLYLLGKVSYQHAALLLPVNLSLGHLCLKLANHIPTFLTFGQQQLSLSLQTITFRLYLGKCLHGDSKGLYFPLSLGRLCTGNVKLGL